MGMQLPRAFQAATICFIALILFGAWYDAMYRAIDGWGLLPYLYGNRFYLLAAGLFAVGAFVIGYILGWYEDKIETERWEQEMAEGRHLIDRK